MALRVSYKNHIKMLFVSLAVQVLVRIICNLNYCFGLVLDNTNDTKLAGGDRSVKTDCILKLICESVIFE